jgi:hypothetical protein
VRFLFKINSSYDGFRPQVIPERIERKGLPLGWGNYIEEVDKDDDVWVYFKGPHRFENGVYVKGQVAAVDLAENKV